MTKSFTLLSLLLAAQSCSSGVTKRGPSSAEDPFQWLEEVEGEKALEFARAENEKTFADLKGDVRFADIQAQIRKIALAKDRVPSVTVKAEYLYNFWQDSEHVRGIWRRTSKEEYRKASPAWETVLDLDQLSRDEKENWVWVGASCLYPAERLCLIKLSRGGKDAHVVREFDTSAKAFVPNGFVIPEAKSTFDWIDQDTLFVGTDFGSGSLSDSGYPIVSKIWKRGEPLAAAKEVFRGQKTDVSAESSTYPRPERVYRVHRRYPSFFEQENWFEDVNGKLHKTPVPASSSLQAVYKGFALFTPRKPWKFGDRTFAQGSLLAIPVASIEADNLQPGDVTEVFKPDGKRFLEEVNETRDHLFLSVLDNVRGRILRGSYQKGKWEFEELPLGKNGAAGLSAADYLGDFFIATYTDFITPVSFYYGDAGKSKGALSKVKTAPERFDARNLTTEQWEAVSKDGTKIPYFIVHPKDFRRDGQNPTLLYGYGGFEVSMTPGYMGTAGKVWLEKGGVYVLANIRGGGEFGPAWHEAAILENKQKSYDDFIAVAEDLIRRKVTSAEHLGIQGGSNGGLLMGAMFTQRPDLFKAVLCEIPLLDMMRFHLLLAGASWMGEYGNPDDPVQRSWIEKYSPYQNVKPGVRYPKVFFYTSTKDDRVHPGHARKMVAKLRSLGNELYYYENTEGGHSGGANLEQKILFSSLEYTYLWKMLTKPMSHPPGK